MLQQAVSKKELSRKIFFIVMIILVAVLAFSMSRLAIPLGVAYVLSLMLRPFRVAINSVSLKRKFFAVFFILFIGFLIFYPLVSGVSTLTSEAHNFEIYLPKLEAYLREKYDIVRTELFMRFNYELQSNPVDSMIDYGKAYTKDLIVYFPKFFTSLFEWSFIIPLFLFFVMKDGKKMRFIFLKMVPNPWVEKVYYLFHQFNTKFGDYIFAKFIEAAIVGTIITTGLLIIDFPFALLLGIVAAITNILPYIGPIIGFLPALVIGLVDQNPDTTLGAMIALYIIANVVDLALVFPILVSKIVNLHPMIVIISVIIGSQFGGAIGMIISIPMAAFVKLLFVEIYRDLYGHSLNSDY